MLSLISRLNGRLDNEIPKERGICIPNGFILDNEGHLDSNIYFLYENNDFKISINTRGNNQNKNDTLFTREREERKTLLNLEKTTIRINEVKLNTINAQEWLINGVQPAYNHTDNKIALWEPYYYFKFETIPPTNPLLSISMYNIDQKTKYSKAQMVEIWDRIVGSLRYKPNAF